MHHGTCPVLGQKKYPTPQNRRQELALCDRVLDDRSRDLETPLRTYLHRYCRDYNSNSTELQLRGTLILVDDIEPSPIFVLEIHVKTSNGDSEDTITYIYEFGEDVFTMANVMFRAKDCFPPPENTRPILTLCNRALHDQSEELQKTIKTYLLHYCENYSKQTSFLELRATLDYVEETHPPPHC